jgi:hypothetical protein
VKAIRKVEEKILEKREIKRYKNFLTGLMKAKVKKFMMFSGLLTLKAQGNDVDNDAQIGVDVCKQTSVSWPVGLTESSACLSSDQFFLSLSVLLVTMNNKNHVKCV